MRCQWLRLIGLPLLAVLSLGAGSRDGGLLDAVKSGDVAAVRALLQQPGAPVNAAEVDGTTALHWAVEYDDLAIVDLLLSRGADVTAANRYGVTPLAPACTNGNAAMIERLLEAGADPNTPLSGGETPLMTASRTGSAEALRVLLAHGADVHAREERRGQTALMWAASHNNAAAIQVLVEAGADLHARAKGPKIKPSRTGYRYGQRRPRVDEATPFLFAVRQGNLNAVQTLAELGANVNDTLVDETSALVVAIASAHWQLADYLLGKGANPNAAGQGWGPLHQLARTRRGLDVNPFSVAGADRNDERPQSRQAAGLPRCGREPAHGEEDFRRRTQQLWSWRYAAGDGGQGRRSRADSRTARIGRGSEHQNLQRHHPADGGRGR